jgi:hypothetical protein
MLRTPEPKERAKLLVKLLKDAGLKLGHQASLNLVAQLEGHRNWNAMEAALKTAKSEPVSAASATAVFPQGFDKFLEAANNVVSNADDAGCEGDLTVTSASAVAALSTLLTKFRREGIFANAVRQRQHAFTAEDVLTIRPDLTLEEAEEVVDIADHRFDATVGVTWDVLETHAAMSFPKRLVEGRLVEQTSGTELSPVVIDYSCGYIYCATLEELATSTKRYELELSAMHRSGKVKLDGVIVIYLPDDTFVDIEFDMSYELFSGDTESLHNSISELRAAEKFHGKKFIQEITTPLPLF